MNSFLETVLTTMGMAVIVLDRDQQVRSWNTHARELWGLTPEEAEGQHLFSLDIGLPMAKLRRQLKGVLSGQSGREQLVVEATNRRGRSFQCQVTFLRLGTIGEDGSPGAVIMMENAEDGG
jgi:two-component system CheB/CheR fusion protein